MNNYQATAETRRSLDSAGLKHSVQLNAMGCLTKVGFFGDSGIHYWNAETCTLCEVMKGVKDEADFLKRMADGPFDKWR